MVNLFCAAVHLVGALSSSLAIFYGNRFFPTEIHLLAAVLNMVFLFIRTQAFVEYLRAKHNH